MNVNKFEIFGKNSLSPREFLKVLLENAADRVNNGVSTTLTARLSSEKPPHDSRHLTDTRTRVSTLLEYSIAYEMNEILESEKSGYSVSTVLWNVFPDLLIRDEKRIPLLGLEVKALHTAAEEKSANLATPLPLIAKGDDYLIILLWGWTAAEKDGILITYPHIHAVDVFDAWLLAKIRDYGWLFNHGNRIKGIDLCSPIINGAPNQFKAEEGNLGKLMRISLPIETPESLSDFAELKAEYEHYKLFLDLILALGLRETFIDVCGLDGADMETSYKHIRYPEECCVVSQAFRKNEKLLLLIAGPSPMRWLNNSDMMNEDNGTHCLWLGQKLTWSVFEKSDLGWVIKGTGSKPDSELVAIQSALGILSTN